MSHKILICLAVSANDGPLAERNLDFIHRLHGKKQVGHCLLVCNPDLHQEMRQKLRVTAELAFETVTLTVAATIEQQYANNKARQMNSLFRHAARFAQDNYRWPWLWLEPDCVPVKQDWIAQLADAYDNQPKKYMGMIAKNGDKQFMSRCGVYFLGASYSLDALCLEDIPFAIAGAEKVVPAATDTKLVQYLKIETFEDLAKISDAAVIVHGDKAGIFSENWSDPEAAEKAIREQIDNYEMERYSKLTLEEMANTKVPQHLWPRARMIEIEKVRSEYQISKKLGRPPKAKLDCVATEGCKTSTPVQKV